MPSDERQMTAPSPTNIQSKTPLKVEARSSQTKHAKNNVFGNSELTISMLDQRYEVDSLTFSTLNQPSLTSKAVTPGTRLEETGLLPN